MKKLLLTGLALIVVWSLAYTPALAETAKENRSAASRSAACRTDCLPGSPHGLYKPYAADPTLMSTAVGRKMYSECVRKCLAPLPPLYFQKILIDNGLPWFGMTSSSCLNCHVSYGRN